MTDATTEALTPKITPYGLALAVVGGVIAAGLTGFVYHLIANQAGIDFVLAPAAILGAIVGAVVGFAARVGGLRAAMLVAVIGFVFGVAGYAVRYFFEFNEFVDSVAQEVDAEREDVLAFLADAYPPGGLAGYLQVLAEEGLTLSRGSSESGAPIQGGLVYGLLGIEALAAGLVAGSTARNALKRAQPAPPDPTPGAPTGS